MFEMRPVGFIRSQYTDTAQVPAGARFGAQVASLLRLRGGKVVSQTDYICYELAAGAPPDIGMHPTADTIALMYIESLVAEGDAGR